MTIRTPDQRLRVFVSSTLGELAAERSVVREAVESLRLTPVMFELGARPYPPRELYRAYLEQSDIFVGLYWQRYGWVAPEMAVSGLEDEYDLSAGMPRLLYVKEPAQEREQPLAGLLERIEAEGSGCYRAFGEPEELGELIRDDLAVLLSERFVTASAGVSGPAPVGDEPGQRIDARTAQSPTGDRSTGTRSVLFTDVVAGTALRQRLGEEAADRLQQRHDQMLTEAVEECRGTVVKGLGDGVMAVFDSAADAVGAGVAAQRAVTAHGRRHPDERFEIRVGISVGDVVLDDSDVHGTVVIEAARLCDAARGGQVLVSELVRALARGRGGFGFEPVGELALKGLPEPVPACAVDFELVELTGDAPVPFPGLLAPPTGLSYVGREGLLGALGDAWEAAVGGQCRAVLVVGEPGTGKTRTASEVARTAFAQGATVLYGRCDEDLAVPYQPFAEALDWQTAHDPTLPLGRFPGDLVRLLPDLDRRVPGLPGPVESDRSFEQHRLFEAVASCVGAVSAERGLVLVLDDVHWATKPTVQLLTHVLRALPALPEARVLVIAAYRDTDLDRVHPLSEALGELRRLPHVSRHPVDPLDPDEVLRLIEAAAGHTLDDEARQVAALVSDETEGNPFFVGELLRHFVETGAIRFEDGRWILGSLNVVDVPEGVRDVIGRRLSRLSPETDDMLRVASLMGRDADLDVLAELVDGGTDAVLDGLDEALRARLVVETGPDRLRFAHALVRSTLAGELSATRRRHWHARILDALERRHPGDVTALAHHALEAGPTGGDLTRAIHYSLAAGEHALVAGAAADALEHFTTTLELIGETPNADRVQDLHARCGLGEAQRDTGDPAHRQTLLAVAHDALAAGQVELALRAALANGRVIASNLFTVDHERVAALQAVLDALDDERPERAALLAAIADELSQDPNSGNRPLELADQARAIADHSGDPALIARVTLASGFVVRVPDRIGQPDRARAAVPAADMCGDPTLRVGTRGLFFVDLLHHGRTSDARAVLEEMLAIAEDASPVSRYHAHCLLAQVAAWDGDLTEARSRNDATLELGQQLGQPDALMWWFAVHQGLAESTGTMADLQPLYQSLTEQFPDLGWVWAGVAYCHLAGGRLDDARRLAEERRVTDPDMVQRDFSTLNTWTGQAELARALGRDDDAATLLSALERHREHWASTGLWLELPIAIPLAECETVVGDHAAATESALAGWHAVLGAGVRCSIPRAAVRVAAVLDEVDTPHARARAVEIATHALREAEAMGMERHVAQLDALRR